MNGKIKTCIVAALFLLVGLFGGLLVPRSLPAEIVGYYVRQPDGSFTYVQQDSGGPMLPDIAVPEPGGVQPIPDWANTDNERANDKVTRDASKSTTDKAVPETSEKATLETTQKASAETSEKAQREPSQKAIREQSEKAEPNDESRAPNAGSSIEVVEKAVKAIDSNDVLVAELLDKKHNALRATISEHEKKHLVQFYVKTASGRTFLVNVWLEAALDRVQPHGDLKQIPAIASLSFIEEITIPIREQKTKVQEQIKSPK